MSYKDVRTLIEKLKILDYPRIISYENFKISNFELMSEIITWVCSKYINTLSRYDPLFGIPILIETESDRISFLRRIAEYIMLKFNIQINTKRLYQADGRCVKELLKPIYVLYEINKNVANTKSSNVFLSTDFLMIKADEMKNIRSMASHITKVGARLYDLLNEEVEMRTKRDYVKDSKMSFEDAEMSLKSINSDIESDIHKVTSVMTDSSKDYAALNEKISKKKAELERSRKRLETLKNFRPAYMDEFEQLESVYSEMYSSYVTKYCNVLFLMGKFEIIENNNQNKLSLLEINRPYEGDGDVNQGNEFYDPNSGDSDGIYEDVSEEEESENPSNDLSGKDLDSDF